MTSAIPPTSYAASRGGWPERVLAIDVGAGTTDILLTRVDEPLENAVKLVAPSRTKVVAAQIDKATTRGQAIVFDGPVMGGGACAAAMKRHVGAGLPFLATIEAALTFADDLERVHDAGVTIVDESELTARLGALPQGSAVLRSGDLGPEALTAALGLLGADTTFDAVAVAAQDHGFSPYESNRVVRFAVWQSAIAANRRLGQLFYSPTEIPVELTRLRAVATQAQRLAGQAPVLIADTGPAALYGALPDGVDDAVLVNVGNSHAICFVALAGCLAGVFEHHTGRLDGARLEGFLRRFLAGELTGEEVLTDGGHGATLAPSAAARDLTRLPIMVTGPRRDVLADSPLSLQFASPHGDMMLSGCFGLLRALRERHGPAERPPAA